MGFFDKFKQSSNPFIKEESFAKATESTLDEQLVHQEEGYMTKQGAINKTFILAAILLFTASFSYSIASPILTIGGAVIGLILVLVASFKQKTSPYIAPAYAAFEGLFVGGISAMYAIAFNGIILQAVGLTISILFVMLFLYKMEIIKVTEKFRSVIMMATGAIALVYLASFALSFFDINIPYLHEGGIIGIGISVAIIVVASLNLLLDFDLFDKGEAYGAPKYMEWFAAMGLIVTLVWLYVEILRLLSKISSND